MFLPSTVHNLISILVLISSVKSQSYNDVICRRPWYFNSPRPAPLRCPTPSFFTYYECCGEFLENCCFRFRPEPIIIAAILTFLLLLLCCCCCIAWIFANRKKKSQKVVPGKTTKTTISKKDSQIQTISSSTMDSGTQWEHRKSYEENEKRRSYAAARDRELDYKYFS